MGRDRAQAVGLLACWTVLAAYLSWEPPPAVDLAAHAAQLQALADLVRGDPLVSSVFEARFVPGYGLPYWLFLPLALLSDGALAARVAWFVALWLFGLGLCLLLRALERPAWTLLLGFPLAFSLVYWYGFLPDLFARSVALLTLGAMAWALKGGGRRARVCFAAGMAATWLCHLVVFAALLIAVWSAAVACPARRAAVKLAALGSALPLLLFLPALWAIVTRVPPARPDWFVYDTYAHTGWFFRYYGPEGWLAAALPLVVSLVFVGLALARWRVEPRSPFAVFCALALLTALMPKQFLGLPLVAVRLPALVGLAALLVADGRALPRPVTWTLCALSLFSLGETTYFHQRYREATAGWQSIQRGPPGRHATVSLVGQRLLGSKLPYASHLGQWITARWGGVGHDLFAEAPHTPVTYRAGERPGPLQPPELSGQELARLDRVFVFGEGASAALAPGFCEVARQGAWHRLERCSP